jgi:hypothetical protein
LQGMLFSVIWRALEERWSPKIQSRVKHHHHQSTEKKNTA